MSLSLRGRLLTAFGVIVVAGAVSGAVATFGLMRINESTSTLYDKHMEGLSSIKDAQIALLQCARYRALFAAAGEDAQRQAYRKIFETNLQRAQDTLSQVRGKLVSQADKDLLANIEKDLQIYMPEGKKYLDLVAKTELPVISTEVSEQNNTAISTFKVVLERVDVLAQRKRESGQAAVKDGNLTYQTVSWFVVTLTALTALIGVALGLRISGRLSRVLGGEPEDATRIARQVAAGDLSQAIAVRAGDDESLLAAMKQMQDRLAEMVAGMRGSSASIATAAAEIAQGNLELSTRTEQQASALQRTAASMEQITGTVSQNADNAAQANTLATSASNAAREGGATVEAVVKTMQEINDSSKRVADITSVIDGIAFQTNILALNAAVEAARAGEQGRGFAVVAAEVRHLAQRSAEAAREIKSLIGANVDRVEAGAQLADKAGEKMSSIVHSIQRVSDIVSEITQASHEQRGGIEQVSNAIHQMDDTTQQNAALVEQSAAAAESLREQARQMVDAVSVFR